MFSTRMTHIVSRDDGKRNQGFTLLISEGRIQPQTMRLVEPYKYHSASKFVPPGNWVMSVKQIPKPLKHYGNVC